MRYVYLFYRYYQHRFGFSRWLCKIQEVQFHANKYKRIVWPYTCNYGTRYSGSTDNFYLFLHSSTWTILKTQCYGRVLQYDSIKRVPVYVHVELLTTIFFMFCEWISSCWNSNPLFLLIDFSVTIYCLWKTVLHNCI